MNHNIDMDPTKTAKHIKIMLLGSPEQMGSAAKMREFLDKTVDTIKMQRLTQTRAFVIEQAIDAATNPDADEGGISGDARGYNLCGDTMVKTSHISAHSWPEKCLIIIDVFSCVDFDSEEIFALAKTFFRAQKWRLTDLSASMRW